MNSFFSPRKHEGTERTGFPLLSARILAFLASWRFLSLFKRIWYHWLDMALLKQVLRIPMLVDGRGLLCSVAGASYET
jgi:hypothetical protein